jgi:hypothetical protein
MNYPKSMMSNKYPEFIRNNEIWNKFKKLNKVFPKLGLKNLTSKFPKQINYEQIYFDYCKGFEKECNFILTKIKGESVFDIKPYKFAAGVVDNNINLVDHIIKTDNAYYRSFCSKKQLLAFIKKVKKSTLTFSSSGKKGQWDIATMSMRGLTSCQRWNAGGEHKYGLIGSVVDPHLGIIYLSSDKKNKYGSKMIARALVRFVKNNNNESAILIERVYPFNYDSAHHRVGFYKRDVKEHILFEVFSAYIKSKTNNEYPVIYGQEPQTTQGYNIPSSKEVEYIMDLYDERECLSYRDSDIEYDY